MISEIWYTTSYRIFPTYCWLHLTFKSLHCCWHHTQSEHAFLFFIFLLVSNRVVFAHMYVVWMICTLILLTFLKAPKLILKLLEMILFHWGLFSRNILFSWIKELWQGYALSDLCISDSPAENPLSHLCWNWSSSKWLIWLQTNANVISFKLLVLKYLICDFYRCFLANNIWWAILICRLIQPVLFLFFSATNDRDPRKSWYRR